MNKLMSKLMNYYTPIIGIIFIILLTLPLLSIAGSQISAVRIPFILNQGQTDNDVLAYAQIFGGKVAIKNNGEIAYYLNGFSFSEHLIKSAVNQPVLEKLDVSRISYFIGSDKLQWKSNIPSYDVINFGKVYDGIEMKLQAFGNNVEKIFHVNPGANPDDIKITVQGKTSLSINAEGELVAGNQASFAKPIAYQEINDKIEYIDISYNIDGNQYGFMLGEYNINHPLIIDPLLASTYLGGSGIEGGDEYWWVKTDIGVDGSIYVAGMTTSIDFPIQSGAYEDEFKAGHDLFIAKFNSDLSALQACTFLGGSALDQIWSFCAGDDGNIYISGNTESTNFPTSENALYKSKSGVSDAFITKLSGDLGTLLASTYLGGNGNEFRQKIALDVSGNIFMVGMTDNATFPKTTGAFDEDYNGHWDLFVSKMDNNLTSLLASTFLGGTFREDYPAIDIDSYGNVIISASTGSIDYPYTSGAFDKDLNGTPGNEWENLDVCVSKLSNDLSSMLASTFYGADDYESGLLLCVDNDNNIIVAGHTWDANFPVTTGVFDENFSGDEYHITKFSNDLSTLIASSFLTPADAGEGFLYDIKTDVDNNIYISGLTNSNDFPITSITFDNSYNGGPADGFIMIINSEITSLIYSTYFGGPGKECISSFEIDESGVAVAAGYTTSSVDFPICGSTYDNNYNGGESDAFLAKFTFDQFTCIIVGPHVNDEYQAIGSNWIDYDNDNDIDIFVPSHTDNNRLYQNDGNGIFSTILTGVVSGEGYSNAGCWADYDNDGDIDGYIANGLHENATNYYYINNGDGSFTKNTSDIISTESAASMTAACADYDNDGNLDIITTSWLFGEPCPDQLYKGNGDGSFIKILNFPGTLNNDPSGGASWLDIDDDGDQDLLVQKPGVDDILYINDGDDLSPYSNYNFLQEPYAQDITWGDYDNDGDMDLFIPNWGYNNSLFENAGDGTFTEVTGQDIVSDGEYSTASCWGDFDNDGDLDLYLVNELEGEFKPDYFYINDGMGNFELYTDNILVDQPGDYSSKVAIGDYDRDGDLDLYVTNWYNNEPNSLYRNNGNSNNWIVIKPIGTISNKSAIGVKVRLKATIGGVSIWQIRELISHTSSKSQSPLELHFGLGDAAIIDSIKVEWPGGQITDILTDVSVNQYMTIIESICGDIDGVPGVNILDVVYIINYKYKSGPEPIPLYAADVNSDDDISILDVVYLINYKYKNGLSPDCP